MSPLLLGLLVAAAPVTTPTTAPPPDHLSLTSHGLEPVAQALQHPSEKSLRKLFARFDVGQSKLSKLGPVKCVEGIEMDSGFWLCSAARSKFSYRIRKDLAPDNALAFSRSMSDLGKAPADFLQRTTIAAVALY